MPAAIVSTVVDWLLLRPQLGDRLAHTAAFLLVLAFSVFLLGTLAKGVLAHIVRVRASRLDDKAALSVVLKHIARGMTLRPSIVPSVAETLRRKLSEILAHDGARA